jgi:hypothetical protein
MLECSVVKIGLLHGSFSVFSLRQAKFSIIYPDLRLDYKVATHPLEIATQVADGLPAVHNKTSFNGTSNRGNIMARRMTAVSRQRLPIPA